MEEDTHKKWELLLYAPWANYLSTFMISVKTRFCLSPSLPNELINYSHFYSHAPISYYPFLFEWMGLFCWPISATRPNPCKGDEHFRVGINKFNRCNNECIALDSIKYMARPVLKFFLLFQKHCTEKLMGRQAWIAASWNNVVLWSV